jgi:preprotein translocase subunit SecA
MRLFKAQIVERVLAAANVPDDVPIESKMVTRAIQSAQSQLEQQNFEIRKNVLKYDDVINKQRTVIYAERLRVLEGEDLRDHVRHMMEDTVRSYVDAATSDGFAEDWDLDKLWTALRTLYPVSITLEEVEESAAAARASTPRC